MNKTYNHLDHEEKIYRLWEESGGFAPRDDADAEPFCVIMPPPNANDPLHVGHASFVAIEDILIRFERMRGKAALWLPGTDHAGIETQYVFEKKLAKEGKSRFEFDRESLYQMIWDYVQENSQTALEQMKKLGASADWSRTKFTLDKEVVEQVVETFGKMHEEGLVYRDLRLVNYCTKCGTGYSDLEVDKNEEEGWLYVVKYELVDAKEDEPKWVEVATTRPETLFGDVAVAVHPEDKRWKKLVGRKVRLPFVEKEIPVIVDEMVEREFGTGLVKITPYHDFADFEVWQRHKEELPQPEQVIGLSGKLNKQACEFGGLNVTEGRTKVLESLEAKGLLGGKQKHKHSMGSCYRCGRLIEPLPLSQFFIRVKPLVEEALKAMDKKEVKIVGAGHDKILRHWLENLRDWNVSRQIVWGIRMPVWYEIKIKQKNNGEVGVDSDPNLEIEVGFLKDGDYVQDKIGELLERYSLEEIKVGLQSMKAPLGAKFVVSPTPPGENYIQETDTFDTWFSSAQWPVVTLKGNDKSQSIKAKTIKGDFERFYPTSVMETGYDILPFWVMRMLLVGIYLTGKVPFRRVYLHGLIRDEKGQKMSKSKGNVVNPLEVVGKYGADALRMALVIRSSPGIDKNVGEGDFRAMRNLTNKIWNAARFVMMDEGKEKAGEARKDEEVRKKLRRIVREVTKQLDGLRVGLAAETVYNQFWHWYCDEVIESRKLGEVSGEVMKEGLVVFLKLLHPFVPYVTEGVWQELVQTRMVSDKVLMVADWPTIKG